MKKKQNGDKILNAYLNNELEQIFCEKCMNTFLTNVYDLDTHVLLEKYSLGLEYFMQAIQQYSIQAVPEVTFIGVIDDLTGKATSTNRINLFSHEEPDYRLIYTMEKLEHLNTEDELFFTDNVHNINWNDTKSRQQICRIIESRYGPSLTHDIYQLSQYYQQHKQHIEWDLHGDNLMRRPSTGEIVILDPYTINYHPNAHLDNQPELNTTLPSSIQLPHKLSIA